VGLWVGKFHILKYNFIPELVKNNPDVFWILVFAGDLEKQKVQAENVKIFHNLPQEDLVNLYNLSDFTISTSSVESFGLTSCESASCDKPIVCYKTGVVWDWWDERLGIRVEEHSYEKFQEAVTKIKEEDSNKYSPRQAIIDKGLTIENFDKDILEAVNYVTKS